MTSSISSFPMPVHSKVSVGQLLSSIGNASVQGDINLKIQSVSSPADAIEGGIVFIAKTGHVLSELIEVSNASVFVVPEPVDERKVGNRCFVISVDPLAWFIRALGILLDEVDLHPFTYGQDAYIDKDVIIGSNVRIGLGTVIERGSVIGDRAVIGSNCFLGRNTIIAEDAFIQNNVSIGSVGLGYHIERDGNRVFFPHLGKVIIGRSVVVGSGVVIVRGQLSDTIIDDFVRLGNLVNVGHNVHIGAHTVLSSNVCVAGGAKIEPHCSIGASAVVGPKLSIGSHSKVGLGSVVVKNVPANTSYFGNPAKPLPTMKDF